MAEISLRAYVSEIEDLVEHNQLEEAIAHCRHILNIHSKHVESYRLLGKALLEQGRHSDAADVFQRVHSVAPDDFVSHVGMAIIHEDETNLDSAIWHMERAFEVQSSNAVIQEELRRLYGRRDGVEPAKIQYTRGALARTYARGGLYPQAIAELQAGLAEEPDRLDLKLLLAEALWRNNDRPEAAEACADVLDKLPFCREANLIMADLQQASGQVDQAKFFRTRVEAVDPYQAYVELPADGDDVNFVPDHAVRVPKLQWSPAAEGERPAAGPEWMSALGISLEQPAAESEVPDWLAEPVEAAPAATGETTSEWLAGLEVAAPAPASEPADSDWLRTLRAESEQAEAAVPSWQTAPEAPGPTPAEPAAVPPPAGAGLQMPEWLHELESVEPGPGPIPQPSEEALPDWLRPEAAAPSDEGVSAGMEAGAGLPDWMQPDQTPIGPAETGAREAFEPAAEMPDWLKPEAAAEELAAGSTEPAISLPDWMRVSDLEPGARQEATGPAEAVPTDWLAGEPATRAGAADEVEWLQPEASPAGGPDVVPGWLREAGAGGETEGGPPLAAAAEAAEASEQPAPAAQIPGWLRESLAATSIDETPDVGATDWAAAAPREEGAPAEAIAPAELPDWIQALRPETEETAAETIAGMPGPEKPAAAPDEVPEWLKEALAGGPASTPEGEWFSDLTAQEQAPSLEAEARESAAPLSGDGGSLGEAAEPFPRPFEAPALPIEPERGPQLDFDRMGAEPGEPLEPRLAAEDETLAWLESLAAKHGAREEELATEAEPQVQPTDIPDWLRSALAKQTGEVEEGGQPEFSETLAEPSAEAIPDWLRPAEEMPSPEPSTERLPDWLRSEQELQPEAPGAPSADLTEDEALAWLEALASQQGAEASGGQGSGLLGQVAEAPGGLMATDMESRGQEPGAPPEFEPSTSAALGGSEDEALAWLEALASKHGVTEGALPAETAEPPEAIASERLPAETTSEAPPPDVLPAWLMETRILQSAPAPEPEREEHEPGGLETAGEPEKAVAEMEAEQPATWPGEVEAEQGLPEAMAAEALPAWLVEAAPREEIAPEPEIGPAEEGDEALAWLEALAAKHGAKEEELVMPAEARAEEMPAWLAEAAAEPEPIPDWLKSTRLLAATQEAEVVMPAAEMPEAPEAEALTGMPAEEPAGPEEPAAEGLPAAEVVDEEALAWLETLAAKHGARDEELVMPAEARTEEMPAWLAEAAAGPEERAGESLPAAEGADEEALAWLEALAAKHGARDEELVMPAEARTEEMPAWLQEQALAEPQAPAPTAEPSVEPAEPALEAVEAGEVPDWLREPAPEEPQVPARMAEPSEEPAEPVLEAAEAGEVPDWLREAMAAQAAEEAPEPVTVAPQAAPAEPLPGWLAQAEAPAEAEWHPGEAAPPEPAPPAEPESWPAGFWPPASEEEARPMQIPAPVTVEQAVATMEVARIEMPPAPAAEPLPKAARPPRKRKRPAEPPDVRLAHARTWLQAGQPAEALDAYESLIKANQSVDAVVADLEAASERSPNRRLLRALGDAYMRQDRLQKALDTYRLALSET